MRKQRSIFGNNVFATTFPYHLRRPLRKKEKFLMIINSFKIKIFFQAGAKGLCLSDQAEFGSALMLWFAKQSKNKARSQVNLCLENTQVQAVLAYNAKFLRNFTVRILQITSIHFGQVFTGDTDTNICTEIQLMQTLVAENKRDY